MRTISALATAAVTTAFVVAACSEPSAPIRDSAPTTATQLAPVASIRILPDTEDIRVGERVRLTLRLRDANGLPLFGRVVEWASAVPATVIVDGAGMITGVGAGRAHIFARSEGRVDTSFVLVTGPAGPPVWYITLSPDTIRLDVGDSLRTALQLRDFKRNLLGGRAVTWRSLAPGVAQVDAAGLVTAVGIGVAQVFAASEGLADTSTVFVGPPPAVAVRVAPDSSSVFVGNMVQLSAAVTTSAGVPTTGSVAWSSIDPAIATVDATGLVSGVAPGRSRIVASVAGVADTAIVGVMLAPVATMTVAPDTATIDIGASLQLTATPRDMDGTALSRAVSWRSLQPQIASVDGAGRATGLAAGGASIVAESEGRADTARITVRPAAVASVVVQPDSTSLLVGATVRLTAATLDASGAALTGRALQWASLQSSIASVDATGLVTAVAPGTSRIVVASEGKTDTARVVVARQPVASLNVQPDTATIDIARTLQLTAVARDAAGSALTGRAVGWQSLQPSVATVSATGGVVGVIAGQAQIVATSEGVADTARITVRAGTPSLTPVARVSLQPDLLTIAVGDTARLRLGLRDASLATLSPTGRVVAWRSTVPAIASIDATGRITGVAAGQTSIIATVEGIADTTVLTVSGTTAPPPTTTPPPPPSTTTGPAGDPSQLPVASRQLPDYARYPGRGIGAGQWYADPATGVRVWRVTDPSTPVANSQAYHDYAAGPVQVSRDWGGERHTLLVMSGGYHLVDFTRGQGLSSWRRAPASNGDLSFTFAQNPATPRIAYFLNGRTLHRYNTQTMQLENTGFFPKDFSSVAAASLGWLQQDHSDHWFVMMANGTNRVIAWNSQTNQTRTIDVANLDEPHLEKDGRYVVLLTGGGSAPIWDLTSGTTHTLAAATPHLEAVRRYFVSWLPSWTSGPQYYADAANGQVVTTLQARDLSPDNMHRAGQWVQSDAQLPGGSLLKQWFLWSGFGDGIVTPGGWTPHAGQIHWTIAGWSPLYQKPSIGVRSVRQYVAGDPTRIARQLAQASSLAGMTEGSFYYDAATTRVYVWLQGGGSPAGQVEMRAPGTIHDGIGFVRVDGTEVRLLAHTYQLYRSGQYWQLPRATVSPDGKVVVFDSNMNDADGRSDVFVVEVPAR